MVSDGRSVEVDSPTTGVRGDEDFFLPRVGVRAERPGVTSRDAASVGLEFNSSQLADTSSSIDSLGRVDADRDFLVLSWNASRSQYLDPWLFGEDWEDPESSKATLAHELVLTFGGQYSPHRLPPQFQRTVGGLYSVRGYRESSTVGDTTLNLRSEYLFHLSAVLPRNEDVGTVPAFGLPFRFYPQQPYGRADWDLIFRVFLDVGRNMNTQRESFESNETLVGTGVGVEFVVLKNFVARVDWGVALTEVESGGERTRVGHQDVHFVFTLLF